LNLTHGTDGPVGSSPRLSVFGGTLWTRDPGPAAKSDGQLHVNAVRYRTPDELAGGRPKRRPVAIVGAGPVGLSAANRLAQQGVPCVVLDDNDSVSDGSRAICWRNGTLEIFDRLGVGADDRQGVTWKVGRVYHGDCELYQFDLLPEGGHKMPHSSTFSSTTSSSTCRTVCELPELIELRWKNRVTAVEDSTMASGSPWGRPTGNTIWSATG